MSYTTDEILQRIQERLDARNANRAGGHAPASVAPAVNNGSKFAQKPDTAPSPALTKLTPEQITSEVFIIAPTQLEFVAETFANAVADAMNMRAFAPRIREIAIGSLRSSLVSAKRQGINKKS